MATGEMASTKHRPIRELVCPDIEEPIGRPGPHGERRRFHRYARRLPGAMHIQGEEYPITCTDIGYGGVQVESRNTVNAAPGEPAAVQIRLGGRSFRDEFAVVQCDHTAGGTSIHLRL